MKILWTCWTTSSRMGAVKTAGRGKDVDASVGQLEYAIVHSSNSNLPPEELRTLTVGLEAIVSDGLGGSADDKRYRFRLLPRNCIACIAARRKT